MCLQRPRQWIQNYKIETFPRCFVLDIEGTTTPISFVTDVLFPFAWNNVGRHLSATYASAETQDDIKLLHSQEADEHPKIYRMKLWATNEVRAKSKFWYFFEEAEEWTNFDHQ